MERKLEIFDEWDGQMEGAAGKKMMGNHEHTSS